MTAIHDRKDKCFECDYMLLSMKGCYVKYVVRIFAQNARHANAKRRGFTISYPPLLCCV